MKKLLLLLVLIANVATAQTKQITVKQFDYLTPSCFEKVAYMQQVNVETHDTLPYLILAFQNKEYETITDMRVLIFENADKDRNQITEFKNTLLAAVPEMGTIIEWKKSKYRIQCYDFLKKGVRIYVKNSVGIEGYTQLSQSSIVYLTDWLTSIGY